MATIAENTRGRRPRTTHRASAGGWVFAAILLIISIGLFVVLDSAVRFETRLSQWAIGLALDTGTRIAGDGTSLLVGLGGARAFTLQIGIACSVVLILVPFLLVAAAMLASGRASVLRTIPAVIVGTAALFVVNLVRMVLIADLTMKDGLEGFGWAHTVYGSAIVLVGLIVVIVVFIAVMSIGRRRARRSMRDVQSGVESS